jgi:hypothetical protein
LSIDGTSIRSDQLSSNEIEVVKIDGTWKLQTHPSSGFLQRSGRLQSVLTTSGTITLMIPEHDEHTLSIALRIAHDLNLYHKLDAQIATHTEIAEQRIRSSPGNVFIIGRPSDSFIRDFLNEGPTPIKVSREFPHVVTVNGQSWDEPSLGQYFPATSAACANNSQQVFSSCIQFPADTVIRQQSW